MQIKDESINEALSSPTNFDNFFHLQHKHCMANVLHRNRTRSSQMVKSAVEGVSLNRVNDQTSFQQDKKSLGYDDLSIKNHPHIPQSHSIIRWVIG